MTSQIVCYMLSCLHYYDVTNCLLYVSGFVDTFQLRRKPPARNEQSYYSCRNTIELRIEHTDNMPQRHCDFNAL